MCVFGLLLAVGALVILLGFASFRSSKVERRYLAIEKVFFLFMAVMLALVFFGCALNGDDKGNTQCPSKNSNVDTIFDMMNATDESQIIEEEWV